jgi:16S rRNA (guanine966-N2)-methyltransferase
VRIVAGAKRGATIAAPPGLATRPTGDRVREAAFNLIGPVDGAAVLDLFAGSGALGLEALSRGAVTATFVEHDPKAIAALRANVEALGATEAVRVVKTDALKYVRGLGVGSFDLALADPPYGQGLAAALAEAFAATPFAGLLCIEHGKDDVLPELAGMRTRRYGDTYLTFITAAE